MTTIIGLDLSLTSTGWSCDGKQGVFSTKNTGNQRLADIESMVSELVRSIDNPAVILEGYSFASRSGQAFSIGELGGVIRLCLHKLNTPVVLVPPTCRAKFATGRGNASKNEVVSSISAKTGIVWSGKGADDMCDAWILEEMGLYVLGRPRYEWTKASTDAFKTIDWSPIGGMGASNTD